MGLHTSSFVYIDLPKGSSFNPSKGSPLIIDKSGKVVTFAHLDPSKLIHAIAHTDSLWLAYELIQSNKGKITPGVIKETKDGMTMKWINDNYAKILAGKFKFGLARRSIITKVGKPGERQLSMSSPREKIVQKAMAMVLSELFEQKGMDYYLGYYPSRRRHTALHMVDRTFRGGKWVIEADLTKCFDRIPHSNLMAVLGRSITCSKTLALISSGLKAGYGNTYSGGFLGTPQGSILSPLLSNIILHEFDLFVDGLLLANTLGSTRRNTPEYRRIQYLFSKAAGDSVTQSAIRREYWEAPNKDPMDPDINSLAYVRYADDFVICVTGPRKLAVHIMGQVERFLSEQLGLEMNREKSLLSDGINFLGCSITNRKVTEKPVKLIRAGLSKGHLSKVSPRHIFHAPIRKLIYRLVERGYFRWSASAGRAVPTAMRSQVNHDHRNILQLYNAVIRGLMNYFGFVDNRKSMGSIIHGLKMSCALTLALKYKLRTAAKVFGTYGSELTCPKTKTSLFIPKIIRSFDQGLVLRSKAP
jgi:retron-type reverse transcriptase